MPHGMFTMVSRCHAEAQVALLWLICLVSCPWLVAPNTTNVLEHTEPSTAAPQSTTADGRLATRLLVALNTTNVLEQTELSTAAPQSTTANGRLATRLLVALNTRNVLEQTQPSTAVPQSVTANEKLATSLEMNQSTATMIAAAAQDSMLCRRCLIAMIALAIVAGVFMITTVVLCSKILNQPKAPFPQQRITKISARGSPTGSSVQALWIEPASTMRERSEIWYGGSAKRKENGLGQHGRGSSDDADLWAQPPIPKVRASRGARQNSLSTAGTDRHLLAPPVITLNQISDFWKREIQSDNSSFKAVPSSHCTVSEAGADSNSTEEHGSEFFQASMSVVEPADPRYTIVGCGADGGSGGSQEEEEEIAVVQPKVTQEQITAFLARSRDSESRFRNGEVTLL